MIVQPHAAEPAGGITISLEPVPTESGLVAGTSMAFDLSITNGEEHTVYTGDYPGSRGDLRISIRDASGFLINVDLPEPLQRMDMTVPAHAERRQRWYLGEALRPCAGSTISLEWEVRLAKDNTPYDFRQCIVGQTRLPILPRDEMVVAQEVTSLSIRVAALAEQTNWGTEVDEDLVQRLMANDSSAAARALRRLMTCKVGQERFGSSIMQSLGSRWQDPAMREMVLQGLRATYSGVVYAALRVLQDHQTFAPVVELAKLLDESQDERKWHAVTYLERMVASNSFVDSTPARMRALVPMDALRTLAANDIGEIGLRCVRLLAAIDAPAKRYGLLRAIR